MFKEDNTRDNYNSFRRPEEWSFFNDNGFELFQPEFMVPW